MSRQRYMQSDLGPLFEPRTLARRNDPETSHEAATNLVESRAINAQCLATLEALRRAPGATTDELAGGDAALIRVYSKRLPDLVSRGLARRGPARPSRLTGRRATTWEVVA